MADLKELSSRKMFGSQQKVYSHTSTSCRCSMKFSIYSPSAANPGTVEKFPVLYFLGGGGSDPDVIIKQTGFQRYASQYKVVVVAPDSSPRNTGLPGESEGKLYGHGMSMYLDSTTPGWKDHYNMFTYVTEELIRVVENNFDFVEPGKRAITGHSMGGHGALICFLKKPELYLSMSCFAPATNASSADSTMAAYLGTDKELWNEWDACELAKKYSKRPIDMLVDIGTRDWFWPGLKVWELVTAVQDKENIRLELKVRGGFDHSYYYVRTFMEEHVKYHAEKLYTK